MYAFYGMWSHLMKLSQYEKKIIAQSFEYYKPRLIQYTSEYCDLIENKETWSQICLGMNVAVNKFNSMYIKLVDEFERCGKLILVQYRYNVYHQRYAIRHLIEIIRYNRDTMNDIILPLDFFMQRVASTCKQSRDRKLRRLNNFIKIIKYRRDHLTSMLSLKYWQKLQKE
jgi:hypothetical protein